MKTRKFNQRGFTHAMILAAFVLVFAVAGAGYLVASHAASKKCVYNTYGRGSSGHCVRDLQAMVKVLGPRSNRHLAVDGQFGSKTTQAVKNFQAYDHLRADGLVGRKTWNK